MTSSDTTAYDLYLVRCRLRDLKTVPDRMGYQPGWHSATVAKWKEREKRFEKQLADER